MVAPREGVVRLRQIRDRGSNHERVEADILDAFDSRRKHRDSRGSRSRDKALRREARPDTSRWLADIVSGPHVAEPYFVHGGTVEGADVAQADELRTSEVKRGEAGHGRAALPGRVGTVLAVVIEVVVRGK